MESDTVLDALAALSQATRLDAFRLLVNHEPEALPASDIARSLAVPANAMSAHLDVLTRAGLASAEQRGRSIVYRAGLDRFRAVVLFLLTDCCGGHRVLCDTLIADLGPCCPPKKPPITDRVYNVLFLCTGNTARSILAESILRKDGGGRFKAFSAGSRPKGAVDPLALKVLADGGYPTEALRSKSWEEFARPDAPPMDFVFTVCDGAAGKTCPAWPGQPVTAHWGIEDPAAVDGTVIERERAFVQALRFLKNRIGAFAALPVRSLDRKTLGSTLHEIGRMEGTAGRKVELA